MRTVKKLLNRFQYTSKSPATIAAAKVLKDKLKRGDETPTFCGELLQVAALYCNEFDVGGNYKPLTILELLLDDYTNFLGEDNNYNDD